MSNSTSDSEIGSIVAGRYRINRSVATTRLAVAYAATDAVTGGDVAVVVLAAPSPSATQRFREAAQRVARLRHPCLPAVVCMGKDGARDYLVFEETPALTLWHLVRESGGVSVARAIDVGLQTGSLLSYLRGQCGLGLGLDLKALRLDTRGNLKVDPLALLEAFSDPVVPRAPTDDVRAVGWLMTGLLTGEAERAPALTAARLPPALEFVLGKATNARVDERYGSLGELAEALRAYWTPRWGPLPDRAAFRVAAEPVDSDTAAAARGSAARPRSVPDDASQEPAPRGRAPSIGRGGPGVAPPSRGPEAVVALLLLVATAAVLGLIPLWATVYLRYIRPPNSTPVPVASATPVTEVSVPDLAGLDERVAYDLLARRGLQLSLVGQDYSETVAPGQVVRQSPEPDTRVRPSSAVQVTLSRGSAGVEVPDVVGQPLSTAEAALVERSLTPSKVDKWSEQAPGIVIAQSPEPGSRVSTGSNVTLTVSAGRELIIGARLGDVARLLVVEPSAIEIRAGETLRVTLRWQALRSGAERYSVFLHFAGLKGEVIAQDDGEPQGGRHPTAVWVQNEIVSEERQVAVPQGTPSGEYTVRVGMYYPPSGPRLPVVDAGRVQVSDNALLVVTVRIVD